VKLGRFDNQLVQANDAGETDMQSWLTFELDGETCRVEKEAAHSTLASYLSRLDPAFERFGRHDPWEGASLVILGDVEDDSHRFRAVDAGLLLLPMVAGRQVWTPEGILGAEPEHPVNLALAEGHFECGPERLGTLRVLMFEGYYRPDLRRQGQTNDQFDAVVTRTANVPAIRETAAQVFASTEQLRHEAAQRAEGSGAERGVWSGKRDIFGDTFTKRLFQMREPGALSYVDEQKRRFHRPESLVDLLRLMREYPGARLVAGGTLVVEESNRAEWSNVISVEAVKEMNLLLTTEEAWEIGGAVPFTRIAEAIGRECPPFNKLMRRFASRPVRNRVTFGGHLATAPGDGQLAPLLMALNARVILLSDEGERDAPISQYYRENGGTILAPGEVIRSVVVPRLNDSALAARGLTSLLADVYTVGVRRNRCKRYFTAAFALELRGHTVAKARLAYAGTGPAPIRAREAEDFLTGKHWSEKNLFASLPILNESVALGAGWEGSDEAESEYRRQLVVTLFQKFAAQHPRPENVRPLELTAAGEFAKLDLPYFDALDT